MPDLEAELFADLERGSWPLYADTRDRFIALVRGLTPDEAGRTVPITPGWTVTQVLAHVCGLNADLAAGMREGLGTDERTAHQVEVRAGHTVDEICDEWLGHEPAVAEIMGGNPYLGRRLGADLVIHLHDVQHAVGQPIDRGDEATVSAGRTYASHMLDRWVEATGVRVEVDLDGARFSPSPGEGAAAGTLGLRASPYDFLRSVSGRRSRNQVAALDWDGDPSPLLDRFSPYAPLPTGDVEV